MLLVSFGSGGRERGINLPSWSAEEWLLLASAGVDDRRTSKVPVSSSGGCILLGSKVAGTCDRTWRGEVGTAFDSGSFEYVDFNLFGPK